MKIFPALLLLLGVASVAHAQQAPAKPVPPPGPLIQKRAPDFSCWILTLKIAPSSKGLDDAPNSEQKDDSKNTLTTNTFTKTGDVLRVQYTDEQKREWNIWLQGKQQVVVFSDGKSIGFAAQPPPGIVVATPLCRDFSKEDFQGFDWISVSNYTGIKQIDGKSCLEFRGTINTNGLLSPVAAYTDLKTRLPVQLDNAGMLSLYEFQAPPSTVQSLPSNVEKLIVDQRRKEQSLAPRPGPAF
jgi:hypothetical protein